jgi:hypothetical protein
MQMVEIRWQTLALVAVLGIAVAQAGAVQDKKPASAADRQSQPSGPKNNPPQSAGENKGQASGGPQEGIRVHGHWSIDILNPDGSLVSHHEFENALADYGQTLAALLGGSTAGRWAVTLSSQHGTSPCQGGTGTPFPNTCRLIESAATNATGGTAEFKTLTATMTAAGQQTGLNTLVLSGSATALVAGQVDRVDTSMSICTEATPRSGCTTAGGALPFTTATPPAVQVAAGQTIRVTVTLSFS